MKTVQIPDGVIFKAMVECDNCPNLEIEVKDGTKCYAGSQLWMITHTEVKCMHYDACVRLKDILDRDEESL